MIACKKLSLIILFREVLFVDESEGVSKVINIAMLFVTVDDFYAESRSLLIIV